MTNTFDYQNYSEKKEKSIYDIFFDFVAWSTFIALVLLIVVPRNESAYFSPFDIEFKKSGHEAPVVNTNTEIDTSNTTNLASYMEVSNDHTKPKEVPVENTNYEKLKKIFTKEKVVYYYGYKNFKKYVPMGYSLDKSTVIIDNINKVAYIEVKYREKEVPLSSIDKSKYKVVETIDTTNDGFLYVERHIRGTKNVLNYSLPQNDEAVNFIKGGGYVD